MTIAQPIGSKFEWGKHSCGALLFGAIFPARRSFEKRRTLQIRYSVTLAEFSHFIRYNAVTDPLQTASKWGRRSTEQK